MAMRRFAVLFALLGSLVAAPGALADLNHSPLRNSYAK